MQRRLDGVEHFLRPLETCPQGSEAICDQSVLVGMCLNPAIGEHQHFVAYLDHRRRVSHE
ncbi:hypothetical protein D3C85_1621390 [compost metagenome]